MITLKTNLINLLGRVVMIALTIYLEYLLIHFGLKDPHHQQKVFWKLKAGHLIYVLIVLFILLVITIFFSLFCIIKVYVDKNNDTITFISLLNKMKISTTDIDNYFDTIHRNKVKEFYGLLLNLKSNKTIQLNGQNLKSIPELKEYLYEKNIHCLGRRRMKFPFN